MPEPKSSMYVLEHQEGWIGILEGKSFLACLKLLFSEAVDVLLMIIWSVSAHLEKILGQIVSGVSQPKSIIYRRDDAVLSSCFTSISLRSVTHTFVQNTVWEDIVIALDAHDKCTEF